MVRIIASHAVDLGSNPNQGERFFFCNIFMPPFTAASHERAERMQSKPSINTRTKAVGWECAVLCNYMMCKASITPTAPIVVREKIAFENFAFFVSFRFGNRYARCWIAVSFIFCCLFWDGTIACELRGSWCDRRYHSKSMHIRNLKSIRTRENAL